MGSNDDLQAAGEFQARLCRENGSPTYAAITEALVERLGRASAPGAAVELLRADGQEPIGSALYLRLFGAVHRLAIDDVSCPLRGYLPSTGGTVDVSAAVPAFFETVEVHRARIEADMQANVQTNEVGRAAVLSAAMNHLAGAVGPKLRLLEIGASAGLNLSLDRYRVVAGDRAWGPTDSPVQLRGHFLDEPPGDGEFVVVERRGCDINPIDLTAPANRRLLRSFVWPEQVDRLRQLDSAIELALSGEPTVIDSDDAVSWTTKHLADLPAGITSVVFHSVVLPYLTSEQRSAFKTVMRTAGERADGDRRLAWISYEYRERHDTFCLFLSVWPGDQHQLLATGNPHGRDVRWVAEH